MWDSLYAVKPLNTKSMSCKSFYPHNEVCLIWTSAHMQKALQTSTRRD